MEILTNYNNDTLQLITSGSYQFSSSDLESGVIKLSVFSDGGSFLRDEDLIENTDFYISEDQLFLKPNEYLDREGFSEGNYNLQFDFISRYTQEEDSFYISEISPSRKEIRLSLQSTDSISDDLQDNVLLFLNENHDTYQFNSFLELSQGRLIPINGYAIDNVTGDKRTLILKLNQPLPSNISTLANDFNIVNKFLSSQTETVFFRDVEELAISGLGLEIDEGYLTQDIFDEDINYSNYQSMTSSFGEEVFDEVKRQKKDINLNVDYSKFSNHVFFGSAESKLKNFKDKAVKLEGLYTQISSSLTFSSSKNVIDRRKNLFKQVRDIKNEFTSYEHFLYNDGQSYSSASAPGIGVNLAGTDFSNKVDDSLTTLQNQEGFDKVYKKSKNADYIHLFTDVWNVEEPPFYNTNRSVYLSFLLRGGKGDDVSSYNLHMSGGDANINYDSKGTDQNYFYGRRRVPFDAYSGSLMSNPSTSTSSYQRYIFKGQQLYWRPRKKEGYDNIVKLVSDDTAWVSGGTYYEILSGSNVISASVSGSFGDGYAYGIKDSTGQYTPYFFPNTTPEMSGSNINTSVTASVLPQGDLFPIVSQQSGNKSAFFTDVKVCYDNPTNIHPFSNVYRPPSGSYAGSSEWNGWYDGLITSASNYDDDNIHSLVNNLPFALRTDSQHETLRDFVNMLGEQFDLLRNYIDNYQNFYKMGYKNPNSIPDNLLSIIGDSIGFDLMNPYSGSITNYLENNEVEGIGIKTAINSLWKKILNNVLYVYKTKGTVESLGALLNLYGFDSDSFKLQEYGGSIDEHNPTVVDNTSADLLDGLKKKSGNISFVRETVPFSMLNLSSGSDYLQLDWWTNGANPNGIEFLFQADKSTKTQTLLRSSGSKDYWDLRLVPSGSSDTRGKIEFRLNYSISASKAIASNHVSMSTDYISNLMSDNIFNVMLQRNVVTASNTLGASSITQSYHMFVARKDDDKIRDVQFISMSSHDSSISASYKSGSYINQNFVYTGSLSSKNLFMGESLSGSVGEVRAWDSYLSMSKFKQHVLNYNSVVGGSPESGVSDIIYRFRLNENIINWNRTPNSASLKIYDSNPQKVKDYSHLISSQRSLNFKTFMSEQNFYKFGVRGTDEIKNDNQATLGSNLKTIGSLDPKTKTLTQPYDNTPKVQISNKIGKSISYVDAIDSLVINLMSDFTIDDYLEDGTMDGIYSDLVGLRKQLISDNVIAIDIEKNIKSAESIANAPLLGNLQKLLPARTKFDFSYNVKNDILFRSKVKRATLQTQLNPNQPLFSLSASFLKPTLSSTANEKFKNGNIDVSDDELTMTGLANHNYKNGTVDVPDNELSVTSLYNENVKTNYATPLDIIDLSNSKIQTIHNMYMTGSNFTDLLLGSKNEFYKNRGTSVDNTFFISNNKGTDGYFNTYKYETRFAFPTIGDTEEFHPVSGTYGSRRGKNAEQPYHHHDNHRHFFNRQFVDSGSYTYTSFFEDYAENGRMIGRTRFFRTDSDGNITYPSNHYIYARTSKDVLDNLIYKGTQNDGSFPTTDPLDQDPKRTVPAYTINVGGSDTLKKLKVIR